MKALLGRKLGMTQLFDEDGNVARVTIVEAGPCVVTQVKTAANDGYGALQIGFGVAKNPAKPQEGHAKSAGVIPAKLAEVRTDQIVADVETAEGEQPAKVGTKLDVSLFEVGDKVQVIGTSKGKGFAGTVKRHNFSTGPKTHGSHNYRAPGSIGAGYPQHVFKGQKMAGQMGGDRVTTKGLKIVRIDTEGNLLAIKGAVPGPKKGIVMIQGLER
ncbi:MAG TPA: 50S ribosomal protein L3 [Candidatus Saccharimonadales bacterium]|nr:50S ribosomal protein L3 [Candidatus Saccharimonadales bacterium]